MTAVDTPAAPVAGIGPRCRGSGILSAESRSTAPMKTKSSIFAATCFAFFVDPASAGAGWTDYTTVAELTATSRHYYEVRLPVRENPSGCRTKTWFYQNYDATGADKAFEVLLESMQSSLRLRVYVTGVCNLKGYAEISSVSVVR